MTVSGRHSDVQFQVSATVMINEVENEGERSEVTVDSTVFVPNPSRLQTAQSISCYLLYAVGVTNLSVL